jgi:hypothetical protein
MVEEALNKFADNMERENLELKQKIKELGATLMPGPLYPNPLNTIKPTLVLENILKRNSKCKGSSRLLQAIRKCVGDEIHKRVDLIQEIPDLAQSIANYSSRITNFKEYLQKDLENDEGFYKVVMITFSAKVSRLSVSHRKEQKLSSTIVTSCSCAH